VVSVGLSFEIINVGDTVTVQIFATDNVGIATRTLTVNGTPLPINASGQATCTALVGGLPLFEATATDSAGNTGTGSRRLRIFERKRCQVPLWLTGQFA
jgi:hypothetical protein